MVNVRAVDAQAAVVPVVVAVVVSEQSPWDSNLLAILNKRRARLGPLFLWAKSHLIGGFSLLYRLLTDTDTVIGERCLYEKFPDSLCGRGIGCSGGHKLRYFCGGCGSRGVGLTGFIPAAANSVAHEEKIPRRSDSFDSLYGPVHPSHLDHSGW